jgi:hypothetical protein
MTEPLFLFYQEPDPDRWIPGDHVPRQWVRRLVRGEPKPGGVMRWYLNLRAGLDQLGINYRVNDYRGLRRNPGAVAHVVGKPHVIDLIPAGHPIVYGPGIAAHPYENEFWNRPEIALILASCDWFKAMYDRDLPRPIRTAVWPAGVETDLWTPPSVRPSGKVLVYDKIRWRRDHYEPTLLQPVIEGLRAQNREVVHLRYGFYDEDDFKRQLKEVSAMVFLCEHETQGFAYLQTLASGVPILAWDRGGFWQDPSMYPHRVQFGPVTSVPYFDERCGLRFADMPEFLEKLVPFLRQADAGTYRPRDFVVEHFDLARQAQTYLDLASTVSPLRS